MARPHCPYLKREHMRILLIRLALVLIVLAGVSGAAYKPFTEFWKKRNTPEFRTAEVSRGDVVSIVNATGKIKPVESILIGAVVSGPIVEMPESVDFNAPIQKGDLMALIDPKLFQARVDADQAAVTIRKADVQRASAEIDRAQAQLAQAERDEARARALREKKNDFVSQAEMDRLRYFRDQLAATLRLPSRQPRLGPARFASRQLLRFLQRTIVAARSRDQVGPLDISAHGLVRAGARARDHATCIEPRIGYTRGALGHRAHLRRGGHPRQTQEPRPIAAAQR